MSFLWPVIGTIAGALISSSGQRSSNQANIQQAQSTNEFNAEQAALAREFNSGEAQISREWSATQAANAMAFSGSEAGRQMDFQERMSNTTYQRAVADMQAAGLNPMLAYSQGGAPAPGGAMGQSSVGGSSAASAGAATGVTARVENVFGSGMANALSSAAGIAKTLAETENIEAQTETEREKPELVRRQAILTNQEVHNRIAEMHLTHEQSDKVVQEVLNLKEHQGIAAAEMMLKRFEVLAAEAKTPAEINEAVAEAKAWAERGNERIWIRDFGSGASAASRARSVFRRQ